MTAEEVARTPFPRLVVRQSSKQIGARLARSPQQGADFVRRRALAGSVEAQIGFGHMLLDGYGVERDPEAAVRWFNLAAKQGHADAFNMLGRCYEHGWGVEIHLPRAAYWYARGAKELHAWAQFNLASLMLTRDVETDMAKALSLLVASARAGNPKAMNMLGRWREQGWDGRARAQSATLWFRLAAEGGCYRGQFHYGRLLARDGKIAEAARWLRSSLTQAPPDFAREGAAILQQHPSKRLRAIADEALAGAEAR